MYISASDHIREATNAPLINPLNCMDRQVIITLQIMLQDRIAENHLVMSSIMALTIGLKPPTGSMIACSDQIFCSALTQDNKVSGTSTHYTHSL